MKSLDNNKSNSKFLNLSIYNQTENKIPQHIIASSDYFFSSCKKPEKFRFFSSKSHLFRFKHGQEKLLQSF